MTGLNGWIILDKPLGITSAGAVARVKRLMRESGIRKPKVGHGGTLDPLATGVLPIALGEATKLTGRMLNGDKSYNFTIRFGAQTATDDREGEIIATSDIRPERQDVEALLPVFTGTLVQTPPAYSALKVEGERAYKRARAGESVEMASRAVTIHSLTVSGAGHDQVTLSARVSKGTYIRALARDIALKLGTVGHVSMLRRTACGPFPLETAIALDNLMESATERGLERMVRPMTAGLDDIPALSVTPDEATALKHGQHLVGRPEQDGSYVAMDGETPVALISLLAGTSRTDRGFNL
ncbi:MAG: tRNA pseudouridine(55) synthase TruB [Pacificimonas sp.]